MGRFFVFALVQKIGNGRPQRSRERSYSELQKSDADMLIQNRHHGENPLTRSSRSVLRRAS